MQAAKGLHAAAGSLDPAPAGGTQESTPWSENPPPVSILSDLHMWGHVCRETFIALRVTDIIIISFNHQSNGVLFHGGNYFATKDLTVQIPNWNVLTLA